MDTLRLMLLSLMIGATVSTSTAYPAPEVGANPAAVYQQQGQQLLPDEPAQVVQQPAVQQQSAVQQSTLRFVTPAPATSSSSASKPSNASSGVIYTGTSITRELYQGCTGDDVRMYQKLLRDLDYDVSVDGTFGKQTRSETIRFQQNNGLKADGIAGTRTIRKLVSGSAVSGGTTQSRSSLSYGMVGPDVMELQYRLKDLGYYADICSGKYLTNTRNGVRWFQSVNGLSADGIAGPNTLSRLYSSQAIPAGNIPPVPTPQPTSVVFGRTLYIGLSGSDVTYFQQLLYNLNYFTMKPTGYFGSETQKATKLFQTYNNLYPDGIAGNATFTKLLSGKAIVYPGSGSGSGSGSIPPIPSPKPTPQTQVGTVCQRCGKVIASGQEAMHSELAACYYHTKCESGDHAKLDCGNHYRCIVTSDKVAQHQTYCAFCGWYECSAPSQCGSNPYRNNLHSYQAGAYDAPTGSGDGGNPVVAP